VHDYKYLDHISTALDIRKLRMNSPFPLGTASNLPEEEIRLSREDMFAILKIPVISIKRVEIKALKKPSLEQDWNGIYQHALDIASGVIDLRTKHSIVPVDRNPTASIVTIKESSYRRKKFFLPEDDASDHIEDPTVESEDSYWTPTPVSMDDMSQKSVESILFSDLLNFQSLLGAFYQTAVTGAQTIIQEYILPDYLKSSTLFRIPLSSLSSAAATASTANAMLPNIFGYDGLIFRIVDMNSHENSEKLSADASRSPIELMNINDESRKVILQDFLGRNLLTESNLRILDRYIDHANANSSSWNLGSSVMKVSTLLSTIVDYAGYRFYVLAPVDISEYQSLTYGFCLSADEVSLSAGQHIALAAARLSPTASPLRSPRSPLAPQPSISSSSTTSTPRSSFQPSSATGMKTYPFVDAMVSRRPSLDSETTRRAFTCLYDELAIEANLSLASYEALSSSSAVAARKNSMGYVRNFQLLSKKLQLHVCRDNRRYLINTENVLPADHPSKAQSMDIFVKKFRPEYVRKLSVKLSPDTFLYPDPTPSSTRIAASMIAVHQLYSEELQDVANLLDSLADHPFDSYSLTKFIHHHGLNCRHFGDLYILCDKPAVQELILIECVARCCKTIFNRALRGLLVGSLQDVDSVIRGLVNGSVAVEENIFREHNQNYQTAMKEIIVKLFNIVLGSNATTQNFWKGPLADLFEKKYGLSLPHEHSIHYPRLFLAIQHHTGNIFQDRRYSFINANIGRQAYVNTNGTHPRFNRPVAPSTADPNVLDISEVFTEDDLISVCQPNVKFWTVFPGAFLHCHSLGESLKHLGLYRDALSIHRVMLSSYHTACSGIKSSNKIQCLIADLEYQYAETLFLSGLYDDARRVLTACKHRSRYTISMARMLTLFMRVEFHAGDYLASLTYYSEALEIYDYLFGAIHGTKSRLAINLAQLFCQSLGYTSEAVELALGHITKAYESLDRVDSTKALAKIALGNRLGQLYLKEQLYQEAMEELSQVAKDIQLIRHKKRGSNKAAHVDQVFLSEKISCLYHLALCQYQCNYKDLAIESAMGYLSLFQPSASATEQEQEKEPSVSTANKGDKQAPPRLNRETITMKRILADLYIHSSLSKHDMALAHLTEAWTTITTSPREFHEILDDFVIELSYQMASVLLLMQTTETRRYLETIDTRVMANAEGKVNDEGLWNESRDTVMKAIWSGKCKEYMSLLITNLHKYSSDGRIDERRISREGLSFAYQTAVLIRMGRKFKRVVLTPDILLQ
jgi:tetratricopeptide (TPR) repeat protein